MSEQKKPAPWLYPPIKGLVRLVTPKFQVEGLEKLPQEPCLVVGNHSQIYGPVACELYFPGNRYTWCAGQMMHVKEVPDYAFRDFWSRKPKWSRPFYRLLSYIIAPVSACIFNNAKTIGVYRDGRILATFKNTVKRLEEGANVVIFPEHDQPYNHILSQFQDKFIDIARLYHKKTGRELSFVPLYIAPKLGKMCLGEPVRFCAGEDMDQQRQRICKELMERITDMAESLPEHTVVPYRNIPKKQYSTNLSQRTPL